MKTFLALSALLSFGAVAQTRSATDPISEQIRLTQDSVRIALNEVENGASQSTSSSPDGDEKIAAFNAANRAALQTFEREVRLQVLTPLQILVNQYNANLTNTTYPAEVRNQMKESLLQQLRSLANERQNIYLGAMQRLHSGMGNFPILAKYQDSSCRRYSSSSNYLRSVLTASGREIYVSGSFSLPSNQDETGCDETSLSKRIAEVAKDDVSTTMRAAILEGCFTSTCYFQTSAAYLVWSSLVKSLFGKPLLITLADGVRIEIKAVSHGLQDNERRVIVATELVAQAVPDSSITRLNLTMGVDRLNALRSLRAAVLSPTFTTATACKAATADAKDLACRTSEGCLNAQEMQMIKDLITPFVNGRPARLNRNQQREMTERREYEAGRRRRTDAREIHKIENEARSTEISARTQCLEN